MEKDQKISKNDNITLVTQNCFFSKLNRKVINLVNDTKADVFCFQEIRNEKTAERIRKRTGYKYVLSKPVKAILGATLHNAIFTNLRVIETGDMNYRKTPGKSNRRAFWAFLDRNEMFAGKVFWAIVEKGETQIKIYNSYLSMNGVGIEERQSILESILNDAKKFDGPTVICGDMNTVTAETKIQQKVFEMWCGLPKPNPEFLKNFSSESEKFVFYETAQKNGFKEISDVNDGTFVFPLSNPVFKKPLFNLKLDWFMIKGFSGSETFSSAYIGDHRAIIGKLTIT